MILLLGGTGMVGSDFEGNFLRPTHQECNALNQEQLASYVIKNKVDTVINCIGFCGHRDTSGRKIHEANVETVFNIARVCYAYGLRLIHFATSIAGEGSTYTICKRYSEEIIKDYCDNYSLVRIPWMIAKYRDNQFMSVIIDHVINEKKLSIYDEIGSIGYARDVSEYIIENIYDLPKEIEVANSGSVTRLEWALEVARLLGSQLKYEIIDGHKKTKQDSHLNGQLRPWRDAVRACLCDKGYSILN